ncbi:hypothetical protein J6590_001571 [Homalodisca vitripennis]|nr:hypothetical protein J6590_001571 [Homalodisca vitripennis]
MSRRAVFDVRPGTATQNVHDTVHTPVSPRPEGPFRSVREGDTGIIEFSAKLEKIAINQ